MEVGFIKYTLELWGLWVWNGLEKILSSPAGPGGVIGSSEIPPGIAVGLFRALRDQENLRIKG